MAACAGFRWKRPTCSHGKPTRKNTAFPCRCIDLMNAAMFNLLGIDPHDPLWPCITLGLSAAIVVGYGVIAFNWYLKSRLQRHAEAAAALARLRGICLACA